MKITSLHLRNYRNYENAEVNFSEGMNVILGNNGQGKTNLLESLVYLSLTRSFRISDDRKLIRTDQPFADLRCSFTDERERSVEAVIHPAGKTLLVDKHPVKKSSDFVGQLNVTLFSPDDLYLFQEQPRARRRLVNQEITKISLPYLHALNRYQNFLKERNYMLKSMRMDMVYLNTLDSRMAEEEAVIIQERKAFCDFINETMPGIYKDLSETEAEASLKYRCCIDPENISKEAVLHMHEESREKDMEYHATSSGIQREDFIFELDGKNMTETASQGQKRMVMLAFRMSLSEYIRKRTGNTPVLLLDDVLSELDLLRQAKLLEMASKAQQCLITTTHIPSFMENLPMKRFFIENGMIRNMEVTE